MRAHAQRCAPQIAQTWRRGRWRLPRGLASRPGRGAALRPAAWACWTASCAASWTWARPVRTPRAPRQARRAPRAGGWRQRAGATSLGPGAFGVGARRPRRLRRRGTAHRVSDGDHEALVNAPGLRQRARAGVSASSWRVVGPSSSSNGRRTVDEAALVECVHVPSLSQVSSSTSVRVVTCALLHASCEKWQHAGAVGCRAHAPPRTAHTPTLRPKRPASSPRAECAVASVASVATGAGVASHLRRGGHTRRRLRSASGDARCTGRTDAAVCPAPPLMRS